MVLILWIHISILRRIILNTETKMWMRFFLFLLSTTLFSPSCVHYCVTSALKKI